MYIIFCNGYLNNDPKNILTLAEGFRIKNEYFLKLEKEMMDKGIHPDKYILFFAELRPYLDNWRYKNLKDTVLELLKKYCQKSSFNLLVLLSNLETLSKIMNTEVIILNNWKRDNYFHFGYSSLEYKQFTYDLDNLLPLIKSVICNSVF